MQLLKWEKYSTALPFIIKVKWIWDPLTSALSRVFMSEIEQFNMFEIEQSNCKRPDKDMYQIEEKNHLSLTTELSQRASPTLVVGVFICIKCLKETGPLN